MSCSHLRCPRWKNKRFLVFLIFNEMLISHHGQFPLFRYNIIIDNVFRVKIEPYLNIIRMGLFPLILGVHLQVLAYNKLIEI